MGLHERTYRLRGKDALLPQPGFAEHLLQQRPHASAQPGGHGDLETPLVAMQDLRREDIGKSPLEQVFPLEAVQLVADGQARREFRGVSVQEGGPHFQRVQHGTAVHLDQDVVQQILTGIDVEGAGQGAGPGGPVLEMFTGGREEPRIRQRIIEPLCRCLPASQGYVNLRLATDTFHRAAKLPPWMRIQSMLTACSPELQEELLASPDRQALEITSLFKPTLDAFQEWHNVSDMDRSFNTYIRGFLLDDILVKVDRCSMLNSLEVRAPFLDRELAEFVISLPVRYKLHGLKRKYLLKKAFADLLPPRILHRNKRGFQIPVSQWLRGRLRPLMEDLLSEEALARQKFFNPVAVRRLMQAHLSGEKDLRTPLWTLMVFQLWWRNNVERAEH